MKTNMSITTLVKTKSTMPGGSKFCKKIKSHSFKSKLTAYVSAYPIADGQTGLTLFVCIFVPIKFFS